MSEMVERTEFWREIEPGKWCCVIVDENHEVVDAFYADAIDAPFAITSQGVQS